MRVLTETEVMQVSGAGATELMGMIGEGIGDILGHKANVIWNLLPGTGVITNIANIFGYSINFKSWGESIGKSIGEWVGGNVDNLFNQS